MATEGLLNFAAATASLVDVDLNRKARGDALEWREQDLMFMEEQRAWHALQVKCRREDMNFRQQEIEQRNLINRRREIDEKNEQLKNISNIAALIGGFSLVVLIELNYQQNVPEWLVALYAATSAITVCLMTYALVTCTLILVGTLKKFEVFTSVDEEESFFFVRRNMNDGATPSLPPNGGVGGEGIYDVERQQYQKTRFMLFWESTCEGDWSRAYQAFSLGVPTFLVNMAIASWIKFQPLISPALSVTVICSITILILFWNAHMKWGKYLTSKAETVSGS